MNQAHDLGGGRLTRRACDEILKDRPGVDERFLHHVIDLGVAPEDAIHDAGDRRRVALVERGEGLFVVARFGDEDRIG